MGLQEQEVAVTNYDWRRSSFVTWLRVQVYFSAGLLCLMFLVMLVDGIA